VGSKAILGSEQLMKANVIWQQLR